MTLRDWILDRALLYEDTARDYASRERYEDAIRYCTRAIALKDIIVDLTATGLLGTALDMPMSQLRQLTTEEK